MATHWKVMSLAAVLGLCVATGAQAIQAVGPTSLHNGFPVWWVDDANFAVGFLPVGAPAVTTPPDSANPFSVLTGFNDEAFFWVGDAQFADPKIIMRVGLEAAYLNGPSVNGDQNPFARTRVKFVGLPAGVAGNCTVTTPYQAITVPAAGIRSNKGTTFDVFAPAPTFAGVLAGAAPHTHFFSVAGAAVGAGGVLTGTGAIAAAPFGNGTLPANLTASIVCAGFTATTTNWLVNAIVFDIGANLPPTAVADTAFTGAGQPVTIDVVANDVDAVAPGTNVHGIDLPATGIVVPGVAAATLPKVAVGTTVVAMGTREPVTTANGGTVVKETDGRLTYTPAAGFTGADTFQYVVQDTGGVVSGQTAGTRVFGTTVIPVGTGNPVPALVTVNVVGITVNQAVFRPKLLKWSVDGTCTAADGSTISLFAGPTADPKALVGTATVAAGSWSFEGKSTLSPAGARNLSTQWKDPATGSLVTGPVVPLAVR